MRDGLGKKITHVSFEAKTLKNSWAPVNKSGKVCHVFCAGDCKGRGKDKVPKEQRQGQNERRITGGDGTMSDGTGAQVIIEKKRKKVLMKMPADPRRRRQYSGIAVSL